MCLIAVIPSHCHGSGISGSVCIPDILRGNTDHVYSMAVAAIYLIAAYSSLLMEEIFNDQEN